MFRRGAVHASQNGVVYDGLLRRHHPGVSSGRDRLGCLRTERNKSLPMNDGIDELRVRPHHLNPFTMAHCLSSTLVTCTYVSHTLTPKALTLNSHHTNSIKIYVSHTLTPRAHSFDSTLSSPEPYHVSHTLTPKAHTLSTRPSSETYYPTP